MKTVLSVLALAVVLTAAAEAEDPKRPGLDDPSLVSSRIEADTEVRVTTEWPTTVYLGEVENPHVENATLMYC